MATLLVTTAFLLTSPTFAQGMQGMEMGNMKMPATPATKLKPRASSKTKARPRTVGPTRSRAAAQPTKHMNKASATAAPAAKGNHMPSMDHGSMNGIDLKAMRGMDMSAGTKSMPGMDMTGDAKAMPGMAMPASSGAMPAMTTPGDTSGMTKSGTDLPAGSAPAPAPPMANYADRIFPFLEMRRSRDAMMQESGAQKLAFVMFNLAEYQPRGNGDGFRWDGQAWYGGDIHRLALKTEGEGKFRDGVETAELQALYSRAIDPYFNLQVGVRQDLGKGPRRTYATIGFEGLAPYMFEVEGALFLSNKGDLLGRLGGYYDQRITQRLILQPRIELNLAARDVPENRIGAGLSNAELGLRLRYEITRQFAPYVGVSWDRKVGATARFARAAGEDATNSGVVAGVRIWF
jgi:copper resistance protein B